MWTGLEAWAAGSAVLAGWLRRAHDVRPARPLVGDLGMWLGWVLSSLSGPLWS